MIKVCDCGFHPRYGLEARGLKAYGLVSLVGLPSAMPIWISPEAKDSGVGILAGSDEIGGGDAMRILLGLCSGESNPGPFTPVM